MKRLWDSSLHSGTDSVIGSVIQKEVDGQYMVHQVRAAADDILIHVTDFTGYVLVEGIPYSRKEPVLVESPAGNPVAFVEAHERLILNDVAVARGK